jgi:hypothetical protein
VTALAAVIVLTAGVARADDPVPADAAAREDARLHDRRLAPRNDNVFVSISQLHDDELASRDMRLSVGAPVLRGDGYGAGLFQRYATTWIDGERFLARGLVLHRFDTMLGGGGRIADGWSLRGGLGVTYASDLHLGSPSLEAMHSTVAVIVRHVIGPGDAWMAGVAYASSSELFPILPVLGYVHQRPGSPFRIDVQLPHHARVEYHFARLLNAAFGLEAHGDAWRVAGTHRNLDARRGGGAMFGELGIAAYGPVEIDLRLGVAFDRYTLPDVMSDTTTDLSLRPASFGQLLVLVR